MVIIKVYWGDGWILRFRRTEILPPPQLIREHQL